MGFFDFLKGKGQPEASSGNVLAAFADGTVVPMEQIPDQVFSQGIMGICCGIEPDGGKIYSPADGVVTQLTETLHAVGLTVGDMEVLIHAGLDTVEMNGDGFTNTVKEGQTVKKGDLLLTMDLEKVRAAGHPTTVVLAVTTRVSSTEPVAVINSGDFASVETTAHGRVRLGDSLMRAMEKEGALPR